MFVKLIIQHSMKKLVNTDSRLYGLFRRFFKLQTRGFQPIYPTSLYPTSLYPTSFAEPPKAAPLLRCSGTSKRTASNPLGQEQHASVRNGNILCVRTLIIAMIAASLGCFVVIEQPKGSWMQEHPCFQDFIAWLNIWRHHIQMGDYGAHTKKPTWLYASPFDSDSKKLF